MNTTLLIQILGVLMALFFCFVIFMCSKTWRILHVICCFLVFAAAATFWVYGTFVLKTHKQWREVYNRLEGELEGKLVLRTDYTGPEEEIEERFEKDGVEWLRIAGIRAKNEKLIKGTGDDADENGEPGIRQLYLQLQRWLVDRGRVWRQCTLTSSDVNNQLVQSVTFQIPATGRPVQPAAEPAAQDAAAGGDQAENGQNQPATQPAVGNAAHGLSQNMLLYVFREGSWTDPDSGRTWESVPRFYLGEFKISSVNGADVTAVSTLPIPEDDPAIGGAAGTWTLCEMMPIDSHAAFAGLSEQQLRSLIDNTAYQVDATTHENTIQKYLRDGKRADADDPPENVWTEVDFKKRYKLDVDSDVAFTTLRGEYFDPDGRAIAARLRRGEEAEIVPGVRGIFPREEADKLAGQGICEKVSPIFMRMLHDYEHHFREIRYQHLYLNARSAAIDRNMTILQVAYDRGTTQVGVRTAEKQRLEEDLAGYQHELDEISAHQSELATLRADLLARLSDLYQTNIVLARELARMDAEATRQIDEKTEAAETQSTSVTPVH